jgi:hypothetical protein
MMIRILCTMLLAVAALTAQSRFGKLELFDSAGRTRIRMDASGIFYYDTSGNQQTKITPSVVEVRGGTITGSQLAPNGVYLRDNVGNMRAYMVTAASPFGGGLFLQKAGGGDKFKVDTADTDAPDSDNGYKVRGIPVFDGNRNASVNNLSIAGVVTGLSGLVDTTTAGQVIYANKGTQALYPWATDTWDIGTDANRFERGYFRNLYVGSANSVSGSLPHTRITASAVQVRGGTTTGSILGPNGVYLRDNDGNQNAYLVSASRAFGFGGGFEFTTSTGAAKFILDSANSSAPDSLNGYDVNGSELSDGNRNVKANDLTVAGTYSGVATDSFSHVLTAGGAFRTLLTAPAAASYYRVEWNAVVTAASIADTATMQLVYTSRGVTWSPAAVSIPLGNIVGKQFTQTWVVYCDASTDLKYVVSATVPTGGTVLHKFVVTKLN